MKVKEFLVVWFCGLAVGVCVGWYSAWVEIPKTYEKEIARLKMWNDRLIQTYLPFYIPPKEEKKR